MDGDDEDGIGFDFAIGAVLGCAAFVWQAVQGEWLFATTLLVVLAVVMPPMTYWGRRFRRWLLPGAEAAGRRWGERHPKASRRLRWVVLPLVGLILLWAAASVVLVVVDLVD